MACPPRRSPLILRCIAHGLLGSVLLVVAAVRAQPTWVNASPAPAESPQPAQLPLLNPVRAPVKSNLMITMDDSGSMAARFMPDSAIRVGAWSVISPAGQQYVLVFVPEEQGGPLVPSVPGSENWRQRVLRSPDTNPVYYNPQIRYRPWLRADGTRYPAAAIAAAALSPLDPGGATANLKTLKEDLKARWCMASSTSRCEDTSQRYAPGLYYRLKQSEGAYLNPSQPANFIEFDVNAATGPARGLGRTDCAGNTCTQQEEQQNFANWFVYYRSRLLLSKAVLGEVLGRMPNQVRVGYGSLRQPGAPVDVDGLGSFRFIRSGVRDFNPERKAQVLDWLYSLTAGSGTPLRQATQEVGSYFEASDSRGPWGETPGVHSSNAQLSCRRAYHLLITDGYWAENSGGGFKPVGNVDGKDGTAIKRPDGTSWTYKAQAPHKDDVSDTLADVAMHYWVRDLQPGLPNQVPTRPGNEAFWQSMSNLIVGLGVRGVLDPATDLPALTQGSKAWSADRIDDLWHAALNSRGAYFSATDPATLQQALRSALASLAPEGRSQGGVAVTSLETGGHVLYQSSFRPVDWSGDLTAANLDAQGRVQGQRWSAEKALPPWQDRKLFIWDDGQAKPAAVPFEWDSMSSVLKAALGDGADAGFVDFLRGDRSMEVDGLARARGGLLGDFINSTPMIAGAGGDHTLKQLPEIGDAYARYLTTTKATRTPLVFIGGNDGILHAFRLKAGSDGAPQGREVFGYVPRAVAGQLSLLRDAEYTSTVHSHRYFVDGPLRESDVHVPAPGATTATWRNYLLGSTGAGPASVFALDITDPTQLGADSVRWEIRAQTEARLGHVLAPVVTGQLPNGKWVALFGNGYRSASGLAHLFVVELETGVVQTVELPRLGTSDGLGGVALGKDSNGRVEAVYAGDLSGRLWRFDFSETSKAGFTVGFEGRPLFKAGNGQPIIQAPLLRERGKSRLILFGTGRLVSDSDVADTNEQALYMVEDRPNETLTRPLAPDQLASRTLGVLRGEGLAAGTSFLTVSGGKINWAEQRGWRFPLTGFQLPEGLRLTQPLQPLALQRELALVGVESPGRVVDPCAESTGGVGLNLLAHFFTGLPGPQPALDTNGDGLVNSQDDRRVIGFLTRSDGLDAVVRASTAAPAGEGSAPAGSAGAGTTRADPATAWSCVGQVMLVGTAGGVAACAATTSRLRDRAWRRILRPPF